MDDLEMTSGRIKRTPERKDRFLDCLIKNANVSKSCEQSGVSRRSIYEWRHLDDAFAAAWDEAVELGTDALEDEAIRRGHEGVEEPVYQGGVLVGHIRKYSDTLLIFMLKARRPEKFKDRISTELTGKAGGPIQVENARDRITDRLASLTGEPAGRTISGGTG